MSGDNQFVVFYLEDNIFAIPLSSVERIVRAVEVTYLPDAPEVMPGVFNMGGRIIPVIDMRTRFRIQKKDLEPWHQFIIVSNSSRTVALWVDGVSGVIERTAEEIVAAAEILPREGLVKSLVKSEEGMVIIFDLETILSLEEEISIANEMSRPEREAVR